MPNIRLNRIYNNILTFLFHSYFVHIEKVLKKFASAPSSEVYIYSYEGEKDYDININGIKFRVKKLKGAKKKIRVNGRKKKENSTSKRGKMYIFNTKRGIK